MTVDLQFDPSISEWPFAIEEIPIICAVSSSSFSIRSPSKPVMYLHRFGNTYGGISFRLKADAKQGVGEIELLLISDKLSTGSLILDTEVLSSNIRYAIPSSEKSSRSEQKSSIRDSLVEALLARAKALTATEKVVEDAIEDGIPADQILKEGLIPAMIIVAEKFDSGELYVPDILISSRVVQEMLVKLRPLPSEEVIGRRGTVVIGTMAGGSWQFSAFGYVKNIVKYMLLSFNFEVIDLGEGVYPEEFVEAVRTHEPGIVVMCAVHPIGMGSMKDTIDALEEVGLRDSIKVMVGGKPVTQEYAERIKADVYFADIYATAGDLHIIIPISGSKDRWKKLSQY